MKSLIWSTAALAVMAVVGASRPALALACTEDVGCPCGDVCSWEKATFQTCVTATAGGDPGWCDGNADCLYENQTCESNACTPAWSDKSICDNATMDAGPDDDGGTGDAGEDAGPVNVDDGGDGGEVTGGDGGTTSGTTATNGGTTSGTSSGTTGGSTTGGSSTGATTGSSSTGGTTGGSSTGGTTGGTVGPACTFDYDCNCGQVCSWVNDPSPSCSLNCGNCVDASNGDPGWCTINGATNECLYEGQSCQFPECLPAWSSFSNCIKGVTGGGTTGGNGGGTGGGTTGGAATSCNNDVDCPCGDVCSWQPPNGTNHICVAGSSGDPGWCEGNNDCLYENQTCADTACLPAYSSTSVCTKASGGTGGTGGSGGTTGASPDAGTEKSSGGGCSSASGSFALIVGLLAIGLLSRKRKDVA